MKPDGLFTEIQSPQNPRIKEVARLRQEKNRRREKKILIDGYREVQRAIRCGVRIEELFLCFEGRDPGQHARLVELSRECGAATFEVSGRAFEKMAFGNRNEGLVAVAGEKKLSLAQLELSESPLVLVLDGIEKPGNIGAVFRTAAAAGVEAILLTGVVAHPWNANAIRSSLGTVFEIPFVLSEYREAIAFLEKHRVTPLVTRVDGELCYSQCDLTQGVAVVLGSEADGVAEDWYRHDSLTLPMNRSVDSLNISATAAIVAFEAKRQRMVSSSAPNRDSSS